jgi:phosphoesterase RecJ-like protein
MDYTHLEQLINRPQKSVLVLHRSPDGDSIGSNLAFYHLLKSKGHTVTLYSKDEVPEYLAFLPGTDQVEVQFPEDIRFDQYDTFWAIDMATLNMIGAEITLPKQLQVVNIDHHISNPAWGTINLIEPTAIAASEVLTKMFQACKIEITTDMATCLMTALATDSGFFKYCRTPESFRIAAILMESGANYENIVYQILQKTRVEDLQFLGVALGRLKIYEKQKAAIITIPLDIYNAYRSEGESTDILNSYTSTIDGTDFGVLITEKELNQFQISFRSRTPGYDVSVLASQLGGGGHKAAAGARIERNSIEEAVEAVLALVK